MVAERKKQNKKITNKKQKTKKGKGGGVKRGEALACHGLKYEGNYQILKNKLY